MLSSFRHLARNARTFRRVPSSTNGNHCHATAVRALSVVPTKPGDQKPSIKKASFDDDPTNSAKKPKSLSLAPRPKEFSSATAAVQDNVDSVAAEHIRTISNESQRSMAATKTFVANASTNNRNKPNNTAKQRFPQEPLSSAFIYDLVSRVQKNALDNRIQVTESGERAFFLDALPIVDLQVYRENNQVTAAWIQDLVKDERSPSDVVFYVGVEAFYDLSFERMSQLILEHNIPLAFSPLVKSTREYLQDRHQYQAMEATHVHNWKDRVIVHLGASHAMDRLLFQEDAQGHLQQAWKDGRLVLLSPELTVVDHMVYRAGLSRVLNQVVDRQQSPPGDDTTPQTTTPYQVARVQPCDYFQLDKDIEVARRRVDEAITMEEAFAEVYRFLIKYIERKQLDSPCYFDSGWESFHLFKSVSQLLGKDDLRIPWNRLGLINARNAAIGDSLHTFYATAPEAFPIVVCGDTAALLAGGISMLNIHSHNRFGVVIIPNNRGMAIEDVISKRSVDGHKYQYEYVKLDRKRDVFTLKQLKEVIHNDILNSLRDHLWGVSSKRSEALVLNIDVQSLRKENAERSSNDAVLMGGSFLSEDFGERFKDLEDSRKRLESVVHVLYGELNSSSFSIADGRQRRDIPVKIQGCSAIEFMEIMSQLSITMREKLKFVPTPTDLLATRTLLPSLLESPRRTVSAPDADSNFVNSNNTFSVFISNAVFGLDGLNNLISTHLEYGTGTLVHLAYDAADVVTHYSLIGQVHRNFGTRPSTILPSLYRNHQAYEGQILVVANSTNEDAADSQILKGLRDPDVKVILVDMGAPNLTASLK